MKKIIIVAALVLGFAAAASAQPRAVGLRGGEISYQHSIDKNFIEVDGGVGFGYGTDVNMTVGATAVYNFMIAQPQWTDRGEWGFYAGPGANVGLGIGSEGNNFLNVSAAGAVGLEYTFWFPLQLSFDFRQHLGLGFGGYGFYNLSSACLAIRYRF